jgi:hypothetical protein
MKDIKEFADLKGEVVSQINGAEAGSDGIIFTLLDGRKFLLYHSLACCESVSVDDVIGDINDLLYVPLLECEEITSSENPYGIKKDYQDSFTWTFYKLGTIKGSVTIRWYGESNGYYSEGVDFSAV